jgi:hypothetical protein
VHKNKKKFFFCLGCDRGFKHGSRGNMEGNFGAATLEPKTPLDFHLKPEDGHPPCRRPRTCASAAGTDVGLSQSNRVMTGVAGAERRAGVPRAETGIVPSTGKLLDAEALQNIRKDLLATQSAQLTRTERKAGLQARLNDVKSQALNPVAERRCLLQRHAGGNGTVDARGLVGLQVGLVFLLFLHRLAPSPD